MKNSNKHIAEEVQKTLDLAEHISPAGPSAAFKSRLMAQLATEETPVVEVSWWRRNRLAIAAAILLLAANAVTVLQFSGAEAPSEGTQGVEAVAEAYNLTFENSY